MNIEQKAKKVKSNFRSMNKVACEVKRVVCWLFSWKRQDFCPSNFQFNCSKQLVIHMISYKHYIWNLLKVFNIMPNNEFWNVQRLLLRGCWSDKTNSDIKIVNHSTSNNWVFFDRQMERTRKLCFHLNGEQETKTKRLREREGER